LIITLCLQEFKKMWGTSKSDRLHWVTSRLPNWEQGIASRLILPKVADFDAEDSSNDGEKEEDDPASDDPQMLVDGDNDSDY
jgi:hypothetical protein